MGQHAVAARVAGGTTVQPSATVNEVRIKLLRKKFAHSPHQCPAGVADSDWAMFAACVHKKRSLTEVSRSMGIPPAALKDTLARVESLMDPRMVSPDRALEVLTLSVRARNALHRLGCQTVEDVLRLDFTGSLRQLGSKTRAEVLGQLGKAGLRPFLSDRPSESEIHRITLSLDRMQSRMHATFESVMRELRTLQHRLKKIQ